MMSFKTPGLPDCASDLRLTTKLIVHIRDMSVLDTEVFCLLILLYTFFTQKGQFFKVIFYFA